MEYKKGLKEITKEKFLEKMKKGEGDFSNLIFNFPVSFKKIKTVDFPMRFTDAVFTEDVDFSRTIFLEEFLIHRAVFEQDANFFYTNFAKRFLACRAVFKIRANFDLTHFQSLADFTRAIFINNVYFKRVRFSQDVFFNKTFFYEKVDFSYAHFSDQYFTSFININKNYTPNYINIGPAKFVFRNIFFPIKTMFNGIDLFKTTFKNSNIENIIFKNCHFLKKFKRMVFYPEIAKTRKILVKKDFSIIRENFIDTILVPKNENLKDLDIDDKIQLVNAKKPEEKQTYFITTKLVARNYTTIKKLMQQIDFKNTFTDYNDLVCKECVTEKDKKEPIIAFRIKKYSEIKSWAVLEDTYRQLKKSLEDSRDWQRASQFYRSEMNAKIKVLKLKNEQWWYRQLLKSYKRISEFGESVPRILLVMLISMIVGVILLKSFLPTMPLDEVFSKNFSLFLPIFNYNTTHIVNLLLKPWQDIIIYIEIFWFYILWLNLAIALRRKLRW